MKANTRLQRDILEELAWEPSLDASHIGVSTGDGVVTLTGYVSNFAEKAVAERTVKRVQGVKAVANDLEVHLAGSSMRSDTELAEACLRVLEWDVQVPNQKVTLKVEKGRVTLEGMVDWQFQRNAAERAIRRLTGVLGVTNLIAIRPSVSAAEVRARIEAALKRSAELESKRLQVTAEGRHVTLSGTVHSWAEREEAERAAWAAPGVQEVDDRITVG